MQRSKNVSLLFFIFSKSKWQGILFQDTERLITMQLFWWRSFFHILLLCVTSRGRLVFCRDCIWTFSRTTEGVGVAEGTDRCKYCGTQCLGRLMNDFPANLAHGPLRIASRLTFTSRPLCRNHGSHHGGSLSSQSTLQEDANPCVHVTLLITSLKIFLHATFSSKTVQLWRLDWLETFAKGY